MAFANSKTLVELIKSNPKFEGSFLCNEKETTPLGGTVTLEFDYTNNTNGLYFEEHESFLNLGEEDFVTYNKTSEGLELLAEAYIFFKK